VLDFLHVGGGDGLVVVVFDFDATRLLRVGHAFSWI
jgi:hypothetical protein